MFNHQEMFHKFLALSVAAAPWDDTNQPTITNLAAMESAYYAVPNTDLNCTLFTSVSDSEWMIAYDPYWVNQLTSRNYPNFHMIFDLLTGYDHDHSAVPGYQVGVVSMFPK